MTWPPDSYEDEKDSWKGDLHDPRHKWDVYNIRLPHGLTLHELYPHVLYSMHEKSGFIKPPAGEIFVLG
jgi:hypothetical protein